MWCQQTVHAMSVVALSHSADAVARVPRDATEVPAVPTAVDADLPVPLYVDGFDAANPVAPYPFPLDKRKVVECDSNRLGAVSVGLFTVPDHTIPPGCIADAAFVEMPVADRMRVRARSTSVCAADGDVPVPTTQYVDPVCQ